MAVRISGHANGGAACQSGGVSGGVAGADRAVAQWFRWLQGAFCLALWDRQRRSCRGCQGWVTSAAIGPAEELRVRLCMLPTADEAAGLAAQSRYGDLRQETLSKTTEVYGISLDFPSPAGISGYGSVSKPIRARRRQPTSRARRSRRHPRSGKNLLRTGD